MKSTKGRGLWKKKPGIGPRVSGKLNLYGRKSEMTEKFLNLSGNYFANPGKYAIMPGDIEYVTKRRNYEYI